MSLSTPDATREIRVRRADPAELPDVVETLTAAFVADPVMSWIIPDSEQRGPVLADLFRLVVEINHPYGELYTTGPQVAASVWVPPGRDPIGDDPEAAMGRVFQALGDNAERLACALELMGEHHPTDPHSYLFFMGTRPQWQSRGLGSAMLREALDQCDRGGTPAYLEATSPDNQRFYLRHGFEVTGQIALPDGPAMWPMWRVPTPGR